MDKKKNLIHSDFKHPTKGSLAETNLMMESTVHGNSSNFPKILPFYLDLCAQVDKQASQDTRELELASIHEKNCFFHYS